MSLEQGNRSIDAIFRSAIANGFGRVKLKYAGGEASLNFPLVLVLHQYALQLAERHGLELQSVLLSNGVAVGKSMIREMLAHGIRLMISLDGVNEHHDAQRPFVNGQGSFRYVEQTRSLPLDLDHNFQTQLGWLTGCGGIRTESRPAVYS